VRGLCFCAAYFGSLLRNYFHAYLRNAAPDHAYLAGSGFGKIYDAAAFERPAICDPYYNRFVVRQVGYFYFRAERKRRMRGSELVLVVDLAVAASAAVVFCAVPRGGSGLRFAFTGCKR
jgi:hypothetical protein